KSYQTREKPTISDYYVLNSQGRRVPEEKGFLEFPKIAGLDGAKVGVLLGQPGQDNGFGKTLENDIRNYTSTGGVLTNNVPLYERTGWGEEKGRPEIASGGAVIHPARLYGGKQALAWTAAVPAALAVGYLLLLLYFRAVGGYKAEVLVGHKAIDEEFTGGV